MTFKAFYAIERAKDKGAALPSRQFIKEISRITKRAEATVRCWLYGTQTPDALAMSILVRKFGMSESELFPNINKKSNGTGRKN